MPMDHVIRPTPRYASCSHRSRPIAIKNQLPVTVEVEEQNEECEKQFYELSTWKMHDRIVSHRLSTPPQASAPIHDCDNGWASPAVISPAGSPVQSQLVRPKPRYARAEILSVFASEQRYHDDLSSSSHSEPSYADGLEDEVFDMEL